MTANAFASLGPSTFNRLVSPLVRRWSLRVTPMTRRRGYACVLGTPESVLVPRRRSLRRHGRSIRMRSRRGMIWSAHGRTTARFGTGCDFIL